MGRVGVFILCACDIEEREYGVSVGVNATILSRNTTGNFCFVYYEQLKNRELKRIHLSGCRCNERIKAKTDGS